MDRRVHLKSVKIKLNNCRLFNVLPPSLDETPFLCYIKNMTPQTLEERVSRLEGQQDGVKERLDQIHYDVQQLENRMDKRFESIDKRFEMLINEFNGRFESIDKRFETLTNDFNARFVSMTNDFNARFAALNEEIRNLRHWIIGFGTIIITLISIYKFFSP